MVLATDLGGTKSRVALLEGATRIVAEVTRPTAGDAPTYLGGLVADLRQLQATAPRVAAIGVGTAGVVHHDGRTIDYAPNLPFDPCFPLADALEEELGLPVTVINDGRASAVGEFRFGDAAGCDPLLALFFGTGIGIGLIAGGSPYGGAANAAGEAGHTLWIPGGRACPCGRRGCFEAYCGGGPMTARAREELGRPPEDVPRWTVDAIVQRAVSDPAAQLILADAERAASALVANLCTLFNPAAVVLGGGVLAGWPALAAAIEEFARGWCAPIVTRDLVFTPSRGGSDAVLWGAAAATGVV